MRPVTRSNRHAVTLLGAIFSSHVAPHGNPRLLYRTTVPSATNSFVQTRAPLSELSKSLTEVQFKLSTLPVTELTHFGPTRLRSWPRDKLKEATIAGRDFVTFRNSGSVEETFGSTESLLVERRDS